jgi:hypothetical protein
MIPFPFISVDHEVNVREMQEIDNAPGSYLEGAGNIISVTDWAHFTLQNFFNGKNFFSHKSTFTGLGINPNLWPSDGSHTLDMQGLGLMFNEFNFDPNYKYRAWYKAKQEIHIGHNVTPKTNPGDYTIQATGDINVRAGKSISLKTGFHAQAGSDFHARIWLTSCDRPGEDRKSLASNSQEGNEGGDLRERQSLRNDMRANDKQYMQIIPNPNAGNFQLKLNYNNPEGLIYVYNMTGHLMHTQKVQLEESTLNLILDQGVYIVKWSNGVFTASKKMIIR